MKHKIKATLLVVFVLLVAIFLWWLKPSLRLRSEKSIRASYLQSTPLNSTSQEVSHFLKKKWPQEKRDLIGIPAYDSGVVGANHIGPIEIGWYFGSFPGLPIIDYVYATWAFDEHDKLIDIIVHKGIDAV
jgi:hypothetical protein